MHFDGFRFARLQSEDLSAGKATGRWGASTLSTTNLASAPHDQEMLQHADWRSRFGYGTHACPGRFFAVRTVKMIFTKLILEYDIKWEGQVKQKPPPMRIEGQFIPNLSQKIILQERLLSVC